MRQNRRSGHAASSMRVAKAKIAQGAADSGLFGRMFPNLPAWEPNGSTEAEQQAHMESIADTMIGSETADPNALNNDGIPSGYTFFGQFVDHDITFDTTSSLERANDPSIVSNFRTPRYDLDSIYGLGLEATPYFFDQTGEGKLLIGKNANGEDDLQRNAQGVAMIGDPRNDENIIISQLQLSIIKVHNHMIDVLHADGLSGHALFEEARKQVRWHYQYVVVHDFLKRIIGETMLNELLPAPNKPKEPRLKFYKPKKHAFMPVEFSVAAYRFGHSMVRPSFLLNKETGSALPFFDKDGTDVDLTDCRGFRPLPAKGTVQWDMMLDDNGSSPQMSNRIDATLSRGLASLPFVNDPNEALANLAFRNILRGWRMGLPSGQAVAKKMGVKKRDILFINDEPQEDPLWQYILHEADVQHNGAHLGEVGGRLVGEVLLGLLANDAKSYLTNEPTWTPQSAGKMTSSGAFELMDFLAFAKGANSPVMVSGSQLPF